MKIKRVVIKNYRGIEERDVEISTTGAVAKGRNGGGKTTLLRAIKAALLAQDIGPDAIRKGAERSEILVDLDDLSVVRKITADGSKLEVCKGEFAVKKPQTYLTELLGTSSLDPMDLLLLKGKERRQRILAALPVTVTVEQLRQWWPKCPDGYSVEGHGLEVIASVRDAAYKKRTEANRDLKVKESEASRLGAEAIAAADAAPGKEPEGIDSLAESADVATKAVEKLRSRQEQIATQQRKTEPQLTKVQELRSKALLITTSLDAIDMVREGKIQQERDDAQRTVDRLAAELEAARTVRDNAQDALDAARETRGKIENRLAEASRLIKQADDIDAALAQAAVEPVSAEEMAMAERGAEQAKQDLQTARSGKEAYDRALKAAEVASTAAKAAEVAKEESARLDAIVKALTEDAPAALLGACDGIPGLGLDGDDVLLDGVRLDALCGAEQVRFCVEVARRANGKSKILVVDGLERLDPEQLDVFVREATRGDYQLIATRVDRGDVVIESLVPDAANDQAAE